MLAQITNQDDLNQTLDQLSSNQKTDRAIAYSKLSKVVLDKDKLERFVRDANDFRLVSLLMALAVLKPDHLAGMLGGLTDRLETLFTSHDSTHTLQLATFCCAAAAVKDARLHLTNCLADVWLEKQVNAEDVEIQAASLTALVKLRFKDENDADKIMIYARHLLRLAKSCESLSQTEAGQQILEGLAILSLLKSIRLIMSKDDALLARLCKVLGKESASIDAANVAFSLSNLYSNLTAYKPILGDQDVAVHRLSRMATNKDGSEAASEADWETADEIERRNSRLISFDIMSSLAVLHTVQSQTTKQLVGQSLNHLAQHRPHRGQMIQQGAIKILLRLAADEQSSSLDGKQALARLLISSNPLLALGPTASSPLLLQAIVPLAALITDDNASLLQQFEALLALTNLASVGEATRNNIVDSHRLMAKIDEFMLDGTDSTAYTLRRRASTELACNVIQSESGFAHFAGDTLGVSVSVTNRPVDLPPPNCRTRLHVLLALCDIEDRPTRIAAAGALAILTVSPRVCGFVLSTEMNSRGLDIVGRLLKEDEDLRMRGMVCAAHLIDNKDDLQDTARQFLVTSNVFNALKAEN